MSGKPARVAMVGLGFGAEFIPIYKAHPDAEIVAFHYRGYRPSTGAPIACSAAAGRVTTSPVYSDDGRSLVHLGLGYSVRDDAMAGYSARPEIHLSDKLLDTGGRVSKFKKKFEGFGF